MRFKEPLSDKIIKRLGRPLTPEEARLLILAETILEEDESVDDRPQSHGPLKV